jgi:hypothetical protein
LNKFLAVVGQAMHGRRAWLAKTEVFEQLYLFAAGSNTLPQTRLRACGG